MLCIHQSVTFLLVRHDFWDKSHAFPFFNHLNFGDNDKDGGQEDSISHRGKKVPNNTFLRPFVFVRRINYCASKNRLDELKKMDACKRWSSPGDMVRDKLGDSSWLVPSIAGERIVQVSHVKESKGCKLLNFNIFIITYTYWIEHGLHFVYMESGGATLLVGTWQREKQE